MPYSSTDKSATVRRKVTAIVIHLGRRLRTKNAKLLYATPELHLHTRNVDDNDPSYMFSLEQLEILVQVVGHQKLPTNLKFQGCLHHVPKGASRTMYFYNGLIY